MNYLTPKADLSASSFSSKKGWMEVRRPLVRHNWKATMLGLNSQHEGHKYIIMKETIQITLLCLWIGHRYLPWVGQVSLNLFRKGPRRAENKNCLGNGRGNELLSPMLFLPLESPPTFYTQGEIWEEYPTQTGPHYLLTKGLGRQPLVQRKNKEREVGIPQVEKSVKVRSSPQFQ